MELLAVNKDDKKTFTCEMIQESTTRLVKSNAKEPKSLLRMPLLSYFWEVHPAALKLFATGLQCITSFGCTWYSFHLTFKVNSVNISDRHPKSQEEAFPISWKSQNKRTKLIAKDLKLQRESLTKRALYKCFAELL